LSEPLNPYQTHPDGAGPEIIDWRPIDAKS